MNFAEGSVLTSFISRVNKFERFCVSCFCSYCKLLIFKIPVLGTDVQNSGFLPAFAKLAVKYRPGRLNTGHLATLHTASCPYAAATGYELVAYLSVWKGL